MGFCCFSWFGLIMDEHLEQQKIHSNEMKRKSRPNKRSKLMTCCCCPCHAAACMFRGIGRCMFVTCYPIVQCMGLDEHRHRHHHHGKHFDWWTWIHLTSVAFPHMIWERKKKWFLIFGLPLETNVFKGINTQNFIFIPSFLIFVFLNLNLRKGGRDE